MGAASVPITPNHLIVNIWNRGRRKSLTNTDSNSGLDLPIKEKASKVSLAVG